MGKVIMSGIVPQLEEPVSFIGDPVFANNDWNTIIEACQENKVHPTWEIGDQKSFTINGFGTYTIIIIGKDHDDYADGSGKAPLTFQMKECHYTLCRMNSSNTNTAGWNGCAMKTTWLPELLGLMLPMEIQTSVKPVNKRTSAGNKSTSIVTSAETLFLLSEIEIFGKVTYSTSGEGEQYEYYAAGNSTVKEVQSDPEDWWTRSPRIYNTSQWCCVRSTGATHYANASASKGMSPAFCF